MYEEYVCVCVKSMCVYVRSVEKLTEFTVNTLHNWRLWSHSVYSEFVCVCMCQRVVLP